MAKVLKQQNTTKMSKLAVILLCAFIAGDLHRSQAGIPESASPVSLSEDLESRCNGHWFSRMRSVMDYIAANQDQLNTCKAIIANETRAEESQVKIQLSGLQESVTTLQTQQQVNSKDFEERLGNLDSQLAAIKEILTNNKPTVTTEKIRSPKFELIGSRYFYIETSYKLNWHGAANQCRQMGGHLATFKDEEELILVQSRKSLSNPIWLGINCLSQRHDHVSLASGKHASFLNWALDEPDARGDDIRCVALNWKFAMYYYYCNDMKNFICQADDEF
ncbi:accessory gland protein Acp29AB-like [Drosophila takahashii]|uniref:accessory gland protein Acp29AB-like n=1 Tax=Drosophila takahashii TaxID=29030 RepID=UPI0038990BD5